jgi:hypothetical protein
MLASQYTGGVCCFGMVHGVHHLKGTAGCFFLFVHFRSVFTFEHHAILPFLRFLLQQP